MAKVNYLSNKELLLEIHMSKLTYCSLVDPVHQDNMYKYYDVIVDSIEDISPDVVEETRMANAQRQAKRRREELQVMGFKPTEIRVKPDPSSVPVDRLIFRVMTFEHIPPANTVKKPKRIADSHQRVNFPPFKHYILVDNEYDDSGRWKAGRPVEVLRSHWRGTEESGHFSSSHGRITRGLAERLKLLVEKYSQRGNWRGYCVDEETEALTQRGWLRWDEINESDMILSYDRGRLTWSKIKSIFRDDYDGNMFHLSINGLDALVTPRHKFITQSGLKEVEYLLEKDRIILTGEPADGPSTPAYDDAFVEMVGWTVTEGCIYRSEERSYPRIAIYQNEGEFADRIRSCLKRLGSHFGETYRPNGSQVCFNLTKDLCVPIAQVIGEGRSLSMQFILALTQHQRKLLIETMVDADGWRTRDEPERRRYCRKSKEHMDSFVALCTLAGMRVSVKLRDSISFGKPSQVYTATVWSDRVKHSNVENINFHGGKCNGSIKGRGKAYHQNEPTVPYRGKVWCPETEFGSFMARRNGYVYLTGNTYVDEMRGQALLQLTQICLQFDESRSETPNPFAYFTAACQNSFRRILNIEKKNQSIRDDLLEMNGVNPSYTRQVEHEQSERTP